MKYKKIDLKKIKKEVWEHWKYKNSENNGHTCGTPGPGPSTRQRDLVFTVSRWLDMCGSSLRQRHTMTTPI